MFRTISIGSSILVQGLFERATADGRIVVKVGGRSVQGRPVDAQEPVGQLAAMRKTAPRVEMTAGHPV